MSSDQTVRGHRARINRLRWWWQQKMGWPGAAAFGLAAFAVVLASWTRPAIDSRRGELAQEQARLDALAPQRTPVVVSNPPALLDPTLNPIPPLRRRGETVARLLELAGSAGVAMGRTEYAAEDQEPDLSRLRITLPFGGSYAQTRAVIAGVLNGLPNAALDSVEIERRGAEPKALDGTLRLSLYFRKDAP